MKTKALFMALLACSTLAFTACEDDDEILGGNTQEVITKAFDQKFPNAKNVTWSNKAGYAKADFVNGDKKTTAWFDNTANLVLTELDVPVTALPKEIQDSFKLTPYADWNVDDIDKLERIDTGNVFIIEVEKGAEEVDLYFAEDGTLIKEVLDAKGENENVPQIIPDAIKDFIKKTYANATIFEMDKERDCIEIDIIDGNIHKEVVMDLNNKWMFTEWEILKTDVPELIMNAFMASEFAQLEIDDIHMVESASGLAYQFEVEDGDKEIKVLFDKDGLMIAPVK